MPLLLRQKLQNGLQLGIWEIDEIDAYFEDRLPEILIDDRLRGRRRTEWLASRLLIKKLVADRQGELKIRKDQYGKPFISGADLHISISHTRRYAAAIVGPSPVGIDIQVPVAKIYRIAHKFLNEKELPADQPLTLEELHIYWGAKESMYKIYGRRRVDFKRHLSVSSINHQDHQLQGQILMPDYTADIALTFQLSERFILVYGWPVANADTHLQV